MNWPKTTWTKEDPIRIKPRYARRNIYIACETMDFTWDEREVSEFDRMWREGLCVTDIAKAFKRDPDEVALLVIDRVKRGFIKSRKNGAFGNRMPGREAI